MSSSYWAQWLKVKFWPASGKSVTRDPCTPTKKKLSYLWTGFHSRRLLLLFSRLQRWGDDFWRKNIYGREILGVRVQVIMEQIGLGQLKYVKLTVLVLGLLNLAIFVAGTLVALGASHAKCPRNVTLGAMVMACGAGLRLVWIFGMGFAQTNTASTMVAEERNIMPSGGHHSNFTRVQRQRWYKRWLWWSRVGTLLTMFQVLGASYFAWCLARNVSRHGRHVMFCPQDEGHVEEKWLMALMVALPTVGGVIVFAQCCVGSDVLAWRLLYGAHYEAWRAHYRQMFDYGIREVLCCLGRRRYLSVLEEDEVDSVAALLGDLVAYRAAGASHLEIIAGVALLREKMSKTFVEEEFQPAPEALIIEATVLHPYAVAAYTGPLLDVGRNPLTFPCAWLYRQGVLSPWKRNRRPALEGDNWWRGHAAAFLRHAQLPPEALRQGRVLQTNRESVYFVVVLHQLRYVLVAVRGTETPEDLLTDGLGRESPLTNSDLRGILQNITISDRVKQEVSATRPHFGHVGVIEAARELAMQLDNFAEDEEIIGHAAATVDGSNSKRNASILGDCRASLLSNKKGLLSSLLGPDGECEGYSLRLVGHSLGGSIAALTGLRLASRFPNLHVYTFGVLPCVDLITAEACSSFTTSIVYNDEFSSRLSVAAIMRLRAAALQALASDTNTDAALVTKLTRRLFKSSLQPDLEAGDDNEGPRRMRRRYSNALKGGAFLCSHACRCIVQMPKHSSSPRQPTSIQLTTLRQNYRQSLESTWDEEYANTAFSNSLDSSGEGVDGFFEQLSNETAQSGVNIPLADGGTVGIDAGTEMYDTEEEAALTRFNVTDELVEQREGEESTEAPFNLLENGMPRDSGGSDLQELWPVEMFVPGLVIHLIRTTGEKKWFGLGRKLTFFKAPKVERKPRHIAVLKDRKHFRDILVSPAMFLDHMPWKCQVGLNDVVDQLDGAQEWQGSSSVESRTNVS